MAETSNSTYILNLGDLSIKVTRKRVKNVNFRIGPGGDVRMSVPWQMSRAEVERMARSREGWMREHLARVERRQYGVAAPRSWETGERLRVWGEEVRLRVTDDIGMRDALCRLDGNELLIAGGGLFEPQARAQVVERWLAGELKVEVARQLSACEERVGARAASITLRRMKSRWGSCTSRKGTIRLNTALAECPRDCTRMVLTHELCHLREANHGPRFYALMDLACPDWRVWQRWLDEHPPRA